MTPDDLGEFLNDIWDQILKNYHSPPQIAGAAPGALIDQQPFLLPAKSLMRLKVAARVVEYYDRTNRALPTQSMMWVRLNNFSIEYKVLKDRKKTNDELTLPVISKSLTVVAFFKAYESFCNEFIGAANCLLSWIYHEEAAVNAAAPALKEDQPYSTKHKSVAGELVARMTHTHPLFCIDNLTVYTQLVTATMGTQYSSTIAPFKRTRDGRGALLALKSQFAGAAHWDKEVRTMSDFMMNMKWTSTTSFTLTGFLGKHRSSFNTL